MFSVSPKVRRKTGKKKRTSELNRKQIANRYTFSDICRSWIRCWRLSTDRLLEACSAVELRLQEWLAWSPCLSWEEEVDVMGWAPACALSCPQRPVPKSSSQESPRPVPWQGSRSSTEAHCPGRDFLTSSPFQKTALCPVRSDVLHAHPAESPWGSESTVQPF